MFFKGGPVSIFLFPFPLFLFPLLLFFFFWFVCFSISRFQVEVAGSLMFLCVLKISFIFCIPLSYYFINARLDLISLTEEKNY